MITIWLYTFDDKEIGWFEKKIDIAALINLILAWYAASLFPSSLPSSFSFS
jgi:hypothetical protein